ncbi:MAG TPA: ABC transporter permease [Cyclobacteriaceae bacterium]|nr:ABC transporter permease [Cyclobacteriaceae bacterium]
MKGERSTAPPKLARNLFIWYSGNAQVDDLVGDMDEIFKKNLQRMSPWKAKGRYWLQIISLIFSYAIKRRRQWSSFHPHSNNSINFHMFRNYFIIAWRTMIRNKVSTTINVLGLSLGISACLLVYMVVIHEFSFDRFHPDGDRIFRVKTSDTKVGWTCPCVPAPGFLSLRDEFAGAEVITGYHEYDAKATIVDGGKEKTFERNSSHVILTDPAYFGIFQYSWLAGGPESLSKPAGVVLTESRAEAYFGSLAPHEVVGKAIVYNDSLHVTVGGVVKDWAENSDFRFTEFISFSTIENSFLRNEINLTHWGLMFNSSQSFIKTKPGDDPATVAAQMTKVIGKNTDEKYAFSLENLETIHFQNDDEGQSTLLIVLYVVVGLAGFILIIAAINFINLSTAQSIKRAREIGIRKVMGSMKLQIVFQFLSETLVLSFMSIILSLALLQPLMSLFGNFLPGNLSCDLLSLNNWLFLGSLMLLVAVLAGTYPALVLSSYLPVVTLSGRGISKGRERWSMRKLLIVFQFSASLFFIIATLVIRNQMDFIQKEDRGFSTSSVLTFSTNWKGEVSKVKTLAERIRPVSGIRDVAVQAYSPMGFALWTSTLEYNGKAGKVTENTSVKPGDHNFIPLYEMRILAGRNIMAADTLNEFVINETLSKRLGFDDPQEAIGEKVAIGGPPHPIVGVVADFHERSFHDAIGPTVIGHFTRELHSIAVRLDSKDSETNAGVISRIQAEFKQVYPYETFEYRFIEDEIGMMHGEEQKISQLATIAMAVTIFISCMGVFGLAMFTAAMRTREIGIRKVLGATAFSITNMLSREFVALILVSIVVATPVAWLAMNAWLLSFIYRTELTIWVFVSAGLIALVTGLATVSYQSLKAALGDPVKALRVD